MQMGLNMKKYINTHQNQQKNYHTNRISSGTHHNARLQHKNSPKNFQSPKKPKTLKNKVIYGAQV